MTIYAVYDSTKVHSLPFTGKFRAQLRRPLSVRAGSAARWCAGGTRRDARRTATPWTRCSGPCTAARGCSGPWTDIWPLLWVSSPLFWALHFLSPNFHFPATQTEHKHVIDLEGNGVTKTHLGGLTDTYLNAHSSYIHTDYYIEL